MAALVREDPQPHGDRARDGRVAEPQWEEGGLQRYEQTRRHAGGGAQQRLRLSTARLARVSSCEGWNCLVR